MPGKIRIDGMTLQLPVTIGPGVGGLSIQEGPNSHRMWFPWDCGRFSRVETLRPTREQIAACIRQELGESYSGFYRKGMVAAMDQAFYGEYITCPYPVGTAEHDAFQYGVRGGIELARRVQAEAM